MKLLVILSCLFAVLSLVTAQESLPAVGNFGELFANFTRDLEEIPEEIITKDEAAEIKSRIPCVMNKINFNDNKNRTIEETTSTYLFIGAGAMCMSDQVTFWKNAADKLYTMTKNQQTVHIDHIECLQWVYSKLQPSSRLLRNFNANINQEDIKMCQELDQVDQIKHLVRYFDILSGGFSELSCGSVNNKIALEFVINVFPLTYEQDQREVDREMKRIADIIKQKVIIMVECIKDNLDI